MRRNRKQKQQQRQQKEQAVPKSSPPAPVLQKPVKPSIVERVSPHSINFGMLAVSSIGLILTTAGLMFQWHQISDLQQSKAESDKQVKVFAQQMETLRSTIGKGRELEISPKLIVESPTVIQLNGDGTAKHAFHVTNVGRGIANNVVATVIYDKSKAGEIDVKYQHFTPESPLIEQKIIPPGRTEHSEFTFPIFPTKEPQYFVGRIGLYCTDTDGNQVISFQHFFCIICQTDDNPHAHVEIFSPQPLTTKRQLRTIEEVNNYLRSIEFTTPKKTAE
jgi:hypothetical protein